MFLEKQGVKQLAPVKSYLLAISKLFLQHTVSLVFVLFGVFSGVLFSSTDFLFVFKLFEDTSRVRQLPSHLHGAQHI